MNDGYLNEAYQGQHLYPEFQPIQAPEFFPRKSDGSYYPPNVPYNSYDGKQPNNNQPSVALTPDEAADVVNHLLRTSSKMENSLNPNVCFIIDVWDKINYWNLYPGGARFHSRVARYKIWK